VPKVIRPIDPLRLAPQRQDDLRGKAHLEPLPSPVFKKCLPSFALRPRKMAGLLPAPSKMRLCAFAEQSALPRPSPRPSFPQEPGWSVRQGAPGATSCSSAVREASRSKCLKCLKSSSRRADRLTDRVAQRQDDLRGKAHAEPLLSLDVRKAFRALHPGPGKWPGLSLHYQLMRLCRFAEQIALPRPSPQSSLLHTGRTPLTLSIPRLCSLAEQITPARPGPRPLIPDPRPPWRAEALA
jgi:hypothetical protein